MRASLIALGLAALLCGCATAAQQQYQTIATGNQAIGAQIKACASAIYNDPAAEPLRAHYPLDIRDASLMQLADASFARPQEVAAITALHPRVKACQKAALDGITQTMPGVVPALVREYSAFDDGLIQLIQRRIPWGEFTKRRRELFAETAAVMQSEAQRVVSGLEQQHERELARRQAAATALAQWAQTQQVINAMSRPVTTNCSGFGYSLQCVSQ